MNNDRIDGVTVRHLGHSVTRFYRRLSRASSSYGILGPFLCPVCHSYNIGLSNLGIGSLGQIIYIAFNPLLDSPF